MPTYEVSLILSSLKKANLIEVLKRSTKLVLDNGGVVRSVENAGTDVLPYTMKARRVKYQTGRYAFMEVDMGPQAISTLSNTLKNDNDVIRHNIVKVAEVPGIEHAPKWKNTATLPADVVASLLKRKETSLLVEQRAIDGLAADAQAILGDMEALQASEDAQAQEAAWKALDSTLLAADDADAVNVLTAAAEAAAAASAPK